MADLIQQHKEQSELSYCRDGRAYIYNPLACLIMAWLCVQCNKWRHLANGKNVTALKRIAWPRRWDSF